MRLKVLALFAAVTLVAACSSSGEETATNENTGSQTVASPPPPPPPPPAPSGPTPGSLADFEVKAGNTVLFAVNRSDLSGRAQTTLDAQAAWLNAFPAVTISIEGHADERGTDDYNLALSARRAASVRDYLIARGISAARIQTLPLGESAPADAASNESAWARNRRSVTVLTGGFGS